MPETDLERSRAYLHAVAEGLCKRDPPALLPLRLREIARNVSALADTAERHLNTVEEPDDY